MKLGKGTVALLPSKPGDHLVVPREVASALYLESA